MMIAERDPSDNDRLTATGYAELFRSLLQQAATRVERPWFHMPIAPAVEESQQLAYRERVSGMRASTDVTKRV